MGDAAWNRAFRFCFNVVMKEVFGMEDEYLLCDPDEKEWRFLLNEIMNTGKYGTWGDTLPMGTEVCIGQICGCPETQPAPGDTLST